MNIAIWIVIALTCFVLPATSLTEGGKRHPKQAKLAEHAEHVGLPLPQHLVAPVVERIQRRQRGMATGGTTGIVVATIIYIIFFTNDDAVGFLVMFVAAMGTAFGAAWSVITHRPTEHIDRPVVARMRSVRLADYLTRGERFGLWVVPAVLAAGILAGGLILLQVPGQVDHILTGAIVAVLAAVTWAVSMYVLSKVLDAPARSESDLELAWDDAERAAILRQVTNLAVVVAAISLMFWLLFIGDAVTSDGFYRQYQEPTWIITATSLVIYGALLITLVAGPVKAWLSGTGRGHEQRQLWPNSVAS